MQSYPLLSILTFFWLLCPLFAGSAGVRNGSLGGQILDANGRGISGISVVVEKKENPPVIRSTVTNADGRWHMGGLQVGSWSVSPFANGFAVGTTPVLEGDSSGSLRAYVESGKHYEVPPIRMQATGKSGDAISTLTLIDTLTGEKIPNATVTIGNHVATEQSEGGYTAVVPVEYSESGKPVTVQVSAPGYESQQAEVIPVPGESIVQSLELEPRKSRVEGIIDSANLPGVDFSRTSIRVDNIPFQKLNAQIDTNGNFSIEVPASTAENVRTFGITFYLRGFHPMRISSVISPEAGAITIAQPVLLTPKTVAIQGRAASSLGEFLPSGLNRAFIPELGLSASVSQGHFSFPVIPVALPLTLKVFGINIMNQYEQGNLSFQATENGGIFTLPSVITSPSGGE